MSDTPRPSNGTGRRSQIDASTGINRRRVLQGTVGAVGVGGLLLSAGSATADGEGGQGIVREEVFKPDQPFEILEVPDSDCNDPTPYGSCREDSLPFRCEGQGGRFPPGKGGALPFPWWYFSYVSGELAGERLQLYTRDNSINTDTTYHWTRKNKDCPETDGYYQVGFAAGGTK